MVRKRREIQVFSMSFLDLLSCALGGVLLLLLITMTNAEQQANSYQTKLTELDKQKLQISEQLKQYIKMLDDAKGNIKKLEKIKQNLEKLSVTLVGINGSMKGTVFVFDTSGSMKSTGFPKYVGLLKAWVKNLKYENFNVIQFPNKQDRVVVWKPGRLVEDSIANRNEALQFINSFRPEGPSTPTMKALSEAFSIRGVDTIVLFSDGRPNTSIPTILSSVRKWQNDRASNNQKEIVINTIGMGDYFGKSFGKFLQDLASANGGKFIGR